MAFLVLLALALPSAVLSQPVPVTPTPAAKPPVQPPFSSLTVPHPARFAPFLDNNVAAGSRMPLSYNVYPPSYFDSIPPGQRSHQTYPKEGTYVYPCLTSTSCPKGMCNSTLMASYEFQTEQMLTSMGLDIYDGAVWTIAQTLVGSDMQKVADYTKNVLYEARTLQLQDIRGDRACKGVMYTGECTDPTQSGVCGFCYGEGHTSLTKQTGLLFRMIGDAWAVQGTKDNRCPDLDRLWTWNDYKPVLGENAWALLLGPLTSAVKQYKTPSAVPDTSPEFQLAMNAIPALQALRLSAPQGQPGYGAIYYTPHNAFFYPGSINMNAGSTVSVENQASVLAGLKAFHYILSFKPQYDKLRCDTEDLISGLESFLLSAWDADKKYFRQGGTYNASTKVWSWSAGGSPDFAVDCQTWVGTVLGPKFIDAKLGAQTSYNLWKRVKQLGGYGMYQNGTVKGVGYSGTGYRGISNATAEASPAVRLWVKSYDPSTFLDRVSYVCGESPQYIKLLNATSAGDHYEVILVFLRQGDATARDIAFSFVKTCNDPTSGGATYLGAIKAQVDEVYSAEWTFGAVNWLRVMANESGYPAPLCSELSQDADFMRMHLEQELLVSTPVQGGSEDHPSFLYANTRYYIPFGWWANSISSIASTSWAVAVDMGWNPLLITGDYSASYPAVSPAPKSCTGPLPPSPTAAPLPPPTPFPQQAHYILADFYQATGGKDWYANDNWLDGLHFNPCGTRAGHGSMDPYVDGWQGVSCDGDGNVVSLNLGGNNLRGTIPESLGQLTTLVYINFQENGLTGSIPTSFSSLPQLETLQLSNNALTGSFPPLTSPLLKDLWVTGNKLTGAFPDLSVCTKLQVLNANQNQLTSVPAMNYSTIQNCDLSYNPLTCPIPPAAKTYCYASCQ